MDKSMKVAFFLLACSVLTIIFQDSHQQAIDITNTGAFIDHFGQQPLRASALVIAITFCGFGAVIIVVAAITTLIINWMEYQKEEYSNSNAITRVGIIIENTVSTGALFMLYGLVFAAIQILIPW